MYEANEYLSAIITLFMPTKKLRMSAEASSTVYTGAIGIVSSEVSFNDITY